MNEDSINELIKGVYEGKYTPTILPEWLYFYTAEELSGMIEAGFGKLKAGDVLESEKAVRYRSNIGVFSGAKTHQEIKELSDFVFNADGTKRAFSEFKKEGLKINDKYNVNYLRTEQDTVFLQSQNARKWFKAEGEKDLFPVLEYVTVGDDRTRPSHARLNGLKARVDDPIWNKIHPQNGWRCRCIVIQHPEPKVSSKTDIEQQTKLIKKEFKKDGTFNHNPAKVDYVFEEKGIWKHTYFKVDRKYKKDLANNFNLPTWQ